MEEGQQKQLGYFEGSFKEGVPHGHGQMAFTNPQDGITMWTGQWLYGEMCGVGEQRSAEGALESVEGCCSTEYRGNVRTCGGIMVKHGYGEWQRQGQLSGFPLTHRLALVFWLTRHGS